MSNVSTESITSSSVTTTTETTTTTHENSDNTGNAAVIIGASVGGVLGFVLIVAIVVFLVWMIKKRNRQEPPVLPHPDAIGPNMFPDSPNSGGSADIQVNDEVKSKINFVFTESDDDSPQPLIEIMNNNKPHINTQHNNPHHSPHVGPKKPLVPKSISESVLNSRVDPTVRDRHFGSIPRQRTRSPKPPDEDYYIEMVAKSPTLTLNTPPPAACKPIPGHGYVNQPEDKGQSSESEVDGNSDVYENFNLTDTAVGNTDTAVGNTDRSQNCEQEKSPKYINIDEIVPHQMPSQTQDAVNSSRCEDHHDGDISEDDAQVDYINMEKTSILPSTSQSFREKLNELSNETCNSSLSLTPTKGPLPTVTGHTDHQTSPPKTGHSSHQGSPPMTGFTHKGSPPTTSAKPKLGQSNQKLLNHSREVDHSGETPVLFKTETKNSDIPSLAKNSLNLKQVTRKASNVSNDSEKHIELDSNVDYQNSEHDLYENSAEFLNMRPQVLENNSDTAGHMAQDNIGAERPRAPGEGAKNVRKPAVLPKGKKPGVKNNQESLDISQLKSRLKKTNIITSTESVED